MSIAILRNRALQLKERLQEALEPDGERICIIQVENDIDAACLQYSDYLKNPSKYVRLMVIDLSGSNEFSLRMAALKDKYLQSHEDD